MKSSARRVVGIVMGMMLTLVMTTRAQERTAFVCEGRIGNAATQPGQALRGDFEYDIGTNTAAPYQTGQFAWPVGDEMGTLVPFAIQYTNQTAYFWIGTNVTFYPVAADVFTVTNGVGTLNVRTRTVQPGSTVRLQDMTLELAGDPNVHDLGTLEANNNASVTTNYPVLGLPAGFIVTGNALFTWDTNSPPGRSQSAFQISATEPQQVVKVDWEQHVKPLTENPAAQGGGRRMFAERDDPTAQPSVDNQTVTVKATVIPRKAGVRVYFASYDVDDPTANTTPVDSNDEVDPGGGWDNRGTPNAGGFVDNIQFADTDANGEARVQFVTTVQPGDNFRVAASLHSDSLENLTVIAQEVLLGKKLVPPNSEPVLDGFDGRVSPLLTVWRTLLVEVHSMFYPDPWQTDSLANHVRGNIVEVQSAWRLYLDVDLRTHLNDQSPNLSDALLPQQYGRFENGEITIGSLQPQAVAGNGNVFVRKELLGGKFTIPFSLTKAGLPLITGHLNDLTPTENATSVSLRELSNPLTAEYVGAELDVAGVKCVVAAVDQVRSSVTVPPGIKIPFWLTDDDHISQLLPIDPQQWPDRAFLNQCFSEAFIQCRTHVKQFPGYSFPFARNCDAGFWSFWKLFGSLLLWETRGQNASDYWTAFLCAAHQGDAFDVRKTNAGEFTYGDRDPDAEVARVEYGAMLSETGGCFIYREVRRELNKSESDAVVHELSHGVGKSGTHPVTDGNGVLDPAYLDLLRRSTRPWPEQ